MRIVPSDQMQGYSLAMLVTHFGWSRVALITVNTFYGFGVASSFQERALTQNITMVRNEAYNKGDRDFHLQMTSLKESDARIFVLVGYGEDAIMVLREAKKFGLIGRDYAWIGSDLTQNMYELLYSTETRLNYTHEDRENAENMIYVTLAPPSRPRNADFTARFKSAYNNTPTAQGYMFRDCLLAIGMGFKKLIETGYTGPQIAGRSTGVNAVNFLRDVRFTSGVEEGSDFDLNGDRNGIFLINTITKGTLITALEINSTWHLTPQSPLVFRTATLTPPPDQKLLTREHLSAESGFETRGISEEHVIALSVDAMFWDVVYLCVALHVFNGAQC
ncbi:hypothetical protein HDU67_002600 [Dinochytrium kinnereticum]|nr:hypothetical protein HDU67_002600 [Dinochytrium kinnereticum]